MTSDAAQKTKRFKVTAETVIVNSDGTKSQLLNLIEGTLVTVDAAGEGEVATKITVTPAPAQSAP